MLSLDAPSGAAALPAAAWRLVSSVTIGAALLTVSAAPAQPRHEAGAASEAVEVGLDLNRTARRQIQLGLVADGFEAGAADGRFGRQTRRAIRGWQASRGVPATGYLDGWAAGLLRGAVSEAVEAALDLDGAARRQVQLGLVADGFEAGAADGRFGRQTRRAIRRWQASQGVRATGYLDGWAARVLLGAGARRPPGVPAASVPDVRPADPVRTEETCAGKPEGAACWMELARQPGCYLWSTHLLAGATVTWPGECPRGVAQGLGTLTWVSDGGQQTRSTGRLRDGKQTGHWVTRLPSGNVVEGPYVDGRRTGNWVFRVADGTVIELRYANGELVDTKFVRRAAPPDPD